MNTLKTKVMGVFALVTLLAFGASWFMLSGILKKSIIDESRSELTRQVQAIGSYLENNGLDSLVRNVENWREMINGRLSVIDVSGKVIADSDTDISTLDNHGNRPEISYAFSEGFGTSIRYSRSLNADLLYVAKGIKVDSSPFVIRISSPLQTLNRALTQSRKSLFLYLIILIAVIILLEFWVIRHFFHPLENIIDVSCRIADGERGHFPIMKNMELQRLSNSLDLMSSNMQRALEQLRGEREELSRIVTSMPIGVILLDREKRVRYINELAKDFLALRKDVSEGMYVERILPSGQLFNLVEQVKDSAVVSYLELPERGSLYLRVSAIPTGAGMLLVITDLTEERKLEQARRTFIADASHELQTPLTTVRVTAEYLLDELQEHKEASKYLSIIIEQQERMSKLVDDLLLLSRIESQPTGRDWERIDLGQMVTSLVNDICRHPFAQEIEIISDIAEEVYVMGRSTDLVRALSNILDNSIKYVREKFGAIQGGRINIRVYNSGSYWKIRISDNGVGITAESVGKIFERFQRGDSHRARGDWGKGGYGLGLSITKRIIEGHGGEIELLRYENGAEFEISLPIYAEPVRKE